MSTAAVGGYFRELREQKKLSRDELAEQFETSRSQIERIEKGETGTRYSLIFSLLDFLGGSETDIRRLLRDDNATIEDGRQAAKAWLSAEETRAVAMMIDTQGVDAVLESAKRVGDMTPEEFIRFLTAQGIDSQRSEK